MLFPNCILINFVTDRWTDGQAQSNMPLQLFQSWGPNYVIPHSVMTLWISETKSLKQIDIF